MCLHTHKCLFVPTCACVCSCVGQCTQMCSHMGVGVCARVDPCIWIYVPVCVCV